MKNLEKKYIWNLNYFYFLASDVEGNLTEIFKYILLFSGKIYFHGRETNYQVLEEH